MTPQQQQPEDSRNTIIFLVCAFALMLSYWFFVERPQAQRAAQLAQQHAAVQQHQQALAPAGPVTLTRAQALAAGPRVQIRTPDLSGSINLKGAAIDDLFLTSYKETTDKNSPPVELFRPVGADHAYYAEIAWGGSAGMPGPDTAWRQVGGSVLSPGHPVDLAFTSAEGLTFRRHIEVDDQYLFKITDTVTNPTNHPVKAQLGAAVVRQGLPENLGKGGNVNAFEGAIGVFPSGGAAPDKRQAYKNWNKKGSTVEMATGGWYGLTDKYWLGAVVPNNQAAEVKGAFRFDPGAPNTYSAGFDDAAQTIAPGATIQKTVDIFAGAKKVDLLNRYSRDDRIPNFKLAIDWGMLWFITQPLFWLLQHIRTGVTSVFGDFADSLGVSILLLTVVVRGAMFPMALRSYSSMSKMKKVQPLVDEVRKKYKDDPAKQQQEMMALYQREKINPIAGCLPMVATIPVFFALYKMLYVTIEMRHQPFLWIKDLAAPDPTTIFNLFGALPYDPSHLPGVVGTVFATTLHIGALPILYGLTTFLQMQMSPTSTDPTQQTMMKVMPFLFMAFLARVPVGLLIYYVWSNLITIGQQWFMMHKHGVDNPIDGFIARLRDRSVKSSSKAAG